MAKDFFEGLSELGKGIGKKISEGVEKVAEKAEEIISANMDMMHKVTAVLIEREKINGEEFAALMRGEDLPAKAAEESAVEEPAVEEPDALEIGRESRSTQQDVGRMRSGGEDLLDPGVEAHLLH